MTNTPILDEIQDITQDFEAIPPRERTKLTGAVAIEVIRTHLVEAGIPVSPSDVYMRGIPAEFYALVVRSSAKPAAGMIYDPLDSRRLRQNHADSRRQHLLFQSD
jgi:hypothetical protein